MQPFDSRTFAEATRQYIPLLRSRFKERLDDPAKQWKISESDYKERKFWDDYVVAYEDDPRNPVREHARAT